MRQLKITFDIMLFNEHLKDDNNPYITIDYIGSGTTIESAERNAWKQLLDDYMERIATIKVLKIQAV